jgi:hypothetical protein
MYSKEDRLLAENVKPGDLWILDPGDYEASPNLSIVEVERVTRTQITLKGKTSKFRRDTGRMVGASQFQHTRIFPGTPERIREVREANTLSRARIKLTFSLQNLLKRVPSLTLKEVLDLTDLLGF